MPEGGTGAPPTHPKSPAVALGFDFGERRIGVACGDTLTGTAQPLGVVAAQAGRPDWRALERHVADWAPGILIVGVPYNMDGTPGRLTEAARGFATALGARFRLGVVTVDERLSSREAEDILRQQRASGARARRVRPGDVDATAACVLLEQWLRGRGRAPGDE